MNLIAKRDFRNPGRSLKIEGAKHPDHIHKGATFSIGGSEKVFDNLNERDKQLLSLLNYADCVGDADKKEVVEAVKAEVSNEEKAAKAASPAK